MRFRAMLCGRIDRNGPTQPRRLGLGQYRSQMLSQGFRMLCDYDGLYIMACLTMQSFRLNYFGAFACLLFRTS